MGGEWAGFVGSEYCLLFPHKCIYERVDDGDADGTFEAFVDLRFVCVADVVRVNVLRGTGTTNIPERIFFYNSSLYTPSPPLVHSVTSLLPPAQPVTTFCTPRHSLLYSPSPPPVHPVIPSCKTRHPPSVYVVTPPVSPLHPVTPLLPPAHSVTLSPLHTLSPSHSLLYTPSPRHSSLHSLSLSQ